MADQSKRKFGLTLDTILRINKVFASNERIESVLIYGSRAKGNYREGSDIDMALKGLQLDHSDLNDTNQKIDELNLPYLFDISIYQKLDNPDLIDHIKRVGQVFYLRER